jgi:cytochrome P450
MTVKSMVPLPFQTGDKSPLDPTAIYRHLREDEPVTRVIMPSGEPARFVTCYADAREVLRDAARFSSVRRIGGMRRRIYDEALRPNADCRDVRQKPSARQAFGYGPHQCPGQQLERMEMRIAMPALFARFKNLRLAIPFESIPFRSSVRTLPASW